MVTIVTIWLGWFWADFGSVRCDSEQKTKPNSYSPTINIHLTHNQSFGRNSLTFTATRLHLFTTHWAKTLTTFDLWIFIFIAFVFYWLSCDVSNPSYDLITLFGQISSYLLFYASSIDFNKSDLNFKFTRWVIRITKLRLVNN